MKAYRMEDLKINIRTGCAMPTGTYELTRKGTRRAVTRYRETFQTDAGIFDPDQWREIARSCVDESDSGELFARIMEDCRSNCVWLKTDKDREEYALKILVGRVYRHWKDFSVDGLAEKTAYVFEF